MTGPTRKWETITVIAAIFVVVGLIIAFQLTRPSTPVCEGTFAGCDIGTSVKSPGPLPTGP